MLARKTCILRFSLCFNAVVVVLFVGPHLAPRGDLEPASAPPPPLGPPAAPLGPAPGSAGPAPAPAIALTSNLKTVPPPSAPHQVREAAGKTEESRTNANAATSSSNDRGGKLVDATPTDGTRSPPPPLPKGLPQSPNSATPRSNTAAQDTEVAAEAEAETAGESDVGEGAGGGEGPGDAEDPGSSQRSLREAIPCLEREVEPRTAQRSDFWVLYNYVVATRRPRCWEAITYTTHADYTFLDNLQPLLERWRGPVSLALHAPGADFRPTLEAIRWARACASPLVAEHVTFHVFFGTRHVPTEVPAAVRALAGPAPNCSAAPPWVNASAAQLYKTRARILYPVNVGRNVAREAAPTHFVLASDIELYPSPGLIPLFLEMVRRGDPPLRRPAPKVFPLSIFEVEKGAPLPHNKTHLVSMLKNGTAIPFHKKLCPGCHNVPHSSEWMAANITEGLHVFYIGKRLGYHVHWEPIFIGTNKDPLYDERLSWEGKSDKMTQGYALCVLDYEFHILDNAFLVHKPGIKTLKKDPQRAVLARKTNNLIKKVIFPELKVLYGVRKGCAV